MTITPDLLSAEDLSAFLAANPRPARCVATARTSAKPQAYSTVIGREPTALRRLSTSALRSSTD